MYIKRILKLFITFIETLLVLFYIFLEELIWERVVKPFNKLIDRYIGRKIKNIVDNLPPYLSLILFITLLFIAELAGLLSAPLTLVVGIFMGIVLYIIKIVVASIAFWVFKRTRNEILTIKWFNVVYNKTVDIYNWIKTTSIYINVKSKIEYIKKRLSSNSRLKKIYVRLKTVFK